MSAESRPITAEAFADALTALPLASVYAKALEIHNSMAHLQRSNAELRQFIDESATQGGDEDCEEAIRENEGVIARMVERLDLVKAELEGRGQTWVDVNGAPETAGMETKEGEVEGQTVAADAVEVAASSEEAAQPASGMRNGDREMRDAAPNPEHTGESTSRPREGRESSGSDGGVYL